MGGGASRTQPVEKSTAAGGAASATADSGAKDTLHASPTGRPADSTRDEHVVAEAKDGAGSSVHHDVKEHHARILHANNNNKQQQEKEEDEERYSAYERRRMLEEEQEREEEEEILALIAQSRHSQASHYYSRMGMEHDGRGSDDDEGEEEGIGYDEGGEERRTRNRTEEDETDEDEEDDANDARNAENRENWQMLTDSLEMDNEDLLFNMLYFAEQDNGGVGVGVGMSCMGRVINNAMSEAVALHSDNNTPYKLKPASADDLQSLEPETLNPADSEKMRKENGDGRCLECAVCMEEMNVGARILTLPACAHCFHADCLFSWFKHQNWCPTCRTPINGMASDAALGAGLCDSPRAKKDAVVTSGADCTTSTTSNSNGNSNSRPAKLSGAGSIAGSVGSSCSTSVVPSGGVMHAVGDDRVE